MNPPQLSTYNRKCNRDGCNGTITVTKEIGNHIFIETNINIYNNHQELKCNLIDIPQRIQIDGHK